MNSLKRLQRRLQEQGRVELRHGVKFALLCIGGAVLGGGCLCAGGMLLLEVARGSYGGEAILTMTWALVLIAIGAFFAFALVRAINVHRLVLAVTRDGIAIGGLYIPWSAVAKVENLSLPGRITRHRPQIVLSPSGTAIARGNKPADLKLVRDVNAAGSLLLWTENMNARSRITVLFLQWVHQQVSQSAAPAPGDRA